MLGPLVRVDTIVGGINLDVNRQLRLGPDSILELMVPDGAGPGGWTVIHTVSNSFDRLSLDEVVKNDGKTVIFDVADINGDLAQYLDVEDLHVKNNGATYRVAEIPKIADNEGQIYRLICAVRTLKTSYFE